MGLDNALDDTQAKTESFAGGVGSIDPVEFIESPLSLLSGHAQATVPHCDSDSGRIWFTFHLDQTAVSGEADRIVQQIFQRLADFAPVCRDQDRAIGTGVFNAMFGGKLPKIQNSPPQ